MTEKWRRKLDDVTAAIRNANGECVFLVGAGVSLSAGIPLANALIEEIRETFPHHYERAEEKTNYNSVMSQLVQNERRVLLNKYIEKARINWAHLALASLFSSKKIDRILTVNFDPLVMRACAMVGVFPAIYDLATASKFKANRIAPNSVFYLNGQHTGFAMLNTEADMQSHKNRLMEIVKDTGTRRTWVVLGYSGDADPLLDVLAEEASFDGGLYWIGFNETPSVSLKNKLLEAEEKDVFYVGGQDADDCLTHLAQRLDSFPPALLVKPFAHIRKLIEDIDFETGKEVGRELGKQLEDQLAIAEKDNAAEKNENGLKQQLAAGKYSDIIKWYESLLSANESPDEKQKNIAAWAYLMLANESANIVRSSEHEDLSSFTQVLKVAYDGFEKAVLVKPDMYQALNNWGLLLAMEANLLARSDLISAQKLWKAAIENYAKALQINSMLCEPLNNWGTALASEAIALAPHDLLYAKKLWQECAEKFSKAVYIKSDYSEALYNWGNALGAEALFFAKNDVGDAIEICHDAVDKYERAINVKPDMHEAFNNWGATLNTEASLIAKRDLVSAQRLWHEAYEKYFRALAIKPDKDASLINWGRALSAEANAGWPVNFNEAKQNWRIAGEKFSLALEMKPNNPDALVVWGLSLDAEALATSQFDLTEAKEKWLEAEEKYAKALSLKPNSYEALNNWGSLLYAEANVLAFEDADLAQKLRHKAIEKYESASELKPDNPDLLLNWGLVLHAVASDLAVKNLVHAREKWSEAGEKFSRAFTKKENFSDALKSWGVALNEEASALASTDQLGSSKLRNEAAGKFEHALSLNPNDSGILNNWAANLIMSTYIDENVDTRQKVLFRAKELSEAAEKLKSGSGAYNLACIEALFNNIESCINWLEVCKESGNLPNESHIACDSDFDGVRQSPIFLDWMARTFKKH